MEKINITDATVIEAIRATLPVVNAGKNGLQSSSLFLKSMRINLQNDLIYRVAKIENYVGISLFGADFMGGVVNLFITRRHEDIIVRGESGVKFTLMADSNHCIYIAAPVGKSVSLLIQDLSNSPCVIAPVRVLEYPADAKELAIP